MGKPVQLKPKKPYPKTTVDPLWDGARTHAEELGFIENRCGSFPRSRTGA